MDERSFSEQIIRWLQKDSYRMQAINAAAELDLNEAYLAAGFVRNLVWDNLYRDGESSALNDIDVIYFNADNTEPDIDRYYENELVKKIDFPWSVKNQARMHVRNGDAPYTSTLDAMSYWTETETAVGARLNPESKQVEVISVFGVSCLFEKTITLNPKRPKPDDFLQRIDSKQWLRQWPQLKVLT